MEIVFWCIMGAAGYATGYHIVGPVIWAAYLSCCDRNNEAE